MPQDTFIFRYDLENMFEPWDNVLQLKVNEDRFGHDVIDEFEGKMNNKFHIRMYHVVPSYPDPAAVLRAMVRPFGEIGKASEFVKLEELLNTAAVESDNVKRHEMYLEIEHYLAEQALVIPVEAYRTNERYRVQPWVHDLKPPKYPGSTFYNV